MGSWGTGIFSNDLAADVREEWRDALVAGAAAQEASAAIVARWAGELVGDGDETEFWTALAAAQHETGHLQPDVRERALDLIAAGGDAELYEEGAPARLKALQRLEAKLRGRQPAPKRLRGPRPGPDPGVAVGDVLRIWSSDRRTAALYVVTQMYEYRRERWPEVMGLLWEGGEIPPPEELERLPHLSGVDGPDALTIMVSRPGDEFHAGIGEIVAHGVRRRSPFDEPVTMTGWESIVEALDGGTLALQLEATRRRLAR